MHKRLLNGLIFVFILGVTGPAFTETGTTSPQLKALDYLEKTAIRLMEEWQDRQQTRRKVEKIDSLSGPVTESETKSQLQLRLKSLLRKGRSNRQWQTYWRNEKTASLELAALYGQLIAGKAALKGTPLWVKKGDGWETLGPDVQAAVRTGGLLHKGEAALMTQWSKAQDAATRARANTKTTQLTLALHAKALENALSAAKRTTQKLNSASLAKKAAGWKSKIATVEKKLATAANAAKPGLTKSIERFKTELAKIEDAAAAFRDLDVMIATHSGAVTLQTLPAMLKSRQVTANTASILKDYLSAQANKVEAKAEAKKAEEALGQLTKRLARYRLLLKTIGNRLKTLRNWSTLAARKDKNQDVYFNAIQADEKAVSERLKGFAESPTDVTVDQADAVCTAPLKKDQTSWQRYQACVSQTQLAIDGLRARKGQLEGTSKLSEKLLKSSEDLLTAQNMDVTLVDSEYEISSHAMRALRAYIDGLTKADGKTQKLTRGSAAWQTLWSGFEQRAKAKTTSLRDAVLATKETRQTLKVNLDLYAKMLANIEGKVDGSGQAAPINSLAYAQKRLDERKGAGQMIGAMLSSAWELIRIGWPALIYLFIAFLLLRLTNRVSKRIVDKARDEGHEDETAEIAALEKQLSQAEASNDIDRAAEIRDQLTMMESRRRDIAQRVETLTTVGRGAVKMLIYIATGLLVLQALTVDIGPILGAGAIFGLAISFGSQSLVKDVVTGFFILLENQYAVGDYVVINGTGGTVEKITLRRTVLRELGGGVHNFPNGSIGSVMNGTQGWGRVVFEIGVAYDTDLDKVREVINSVGDEFYQDPEWTSRLLERPRYVGVIAFGASDVTVRAMFKTHTFQQGGAKREFSYRVKNAFDTHGIEIPFPQQDIHVIGLNQLPDPKSA